MAVRDPCGLSPVFGAPRPPALCVSVYVGTDASPLRSHALGASQLKSPLSRMSIEEDSSLQRARATVARLPVLTAHRDSESGAGSSDTKQAIEKADGSTSKAAIAAGVQTIPLTVDQVLQISFVTNRGIHLLCARGQAKGHGFLPSHGTMLHVLKFLAARRMRGNSSKAPSTPANWPILTSRRPETWS